MACPLGPRGLTPGVVLSSPKQRTRPLARGALGVWIAALLAIGAYGCGHGQYVWFQELPATTALANSEYVIGVGDVVSIRVLGHEEMSLKQRVRSDGRLALLLVGDVEAKGKRPSAL